MPLDIGKTKTSGWRPWIGVEKPFVNQIVARRAARAMQSGHLTLASITIATFTGAGTAL
jgi:hypothetical protein